ncbi:hypothetical protein BJX65DRAFT_267619 [Aspergillus insuetus]
MSVRRKMSQWLGRARVKIQATCCYSIAIATLFRDISPTLLFSGSLSTPSLFIIDLNERCLLSSYPPLCAYLSYRSMLPGDEACTKSQSCRISGLGVLRVHKLLPGNQ